jgi:hypothetical protein
MGCENKSFKYLFRDIDGAYPTDDDHWVVPEIIELYPKFNIDHHAPDGLYGAVPELVREIYQESLLAIQEDALTLAGLGLRGTIEAICNDLKITGRNLGIRISRLATQGVISTKDAERLHAIRFLGNDAAHEIKKPTKDQISVALKIIDHLIQSVYILQSEAAGSLDTIVTQVDELKNLLQKHLKNFKAADEFPLAKFLGKDTRRLGTSASQLETQLILEINSGAYKALAVGKVAVYAGSSAPLQHFIMV